MTRYRTKPVYVEAERFDPEDEEQRERWGIRVGRLEEELFFVGDEELYPDDWLVRDRGETKVVMERDFAATYEEVQDG